MLLLLGCGQVCAASKLRVLTENYPPFAFTQDGQVTGIGVDVLHVALADTGIAYDIQVLPWARAFKATLEQPNTLLFPTGRNQDREALFEWVHLITEVEFGLWSRNDRDDIQLNSIDSLKGYDVGGMHGGFSTVWLEQQHQIPHRIKVSNIDRLLQSLHKGRIDLISYETFALRYLAKQYQYPKGAFRKVLDLPELTTGFYFAMNKHSDPALVKSLKQRLNTVKQAQGYPSIISRYQ